MASFYELETAIFDLIDEETGELKDYEAFEKLNMEKNEKIENVALWQKSLLAEAEAIKKEAANLTARAKAKESRATQLEGLLTQVLAGAKFETPKCKINYRKSTAIEIEDEAKFIESAPEQYLTIKKPTVNKTAIKEAIKAGIDVEGAKLVERSNIIIK